MALPSYNEKPRNSSVTLGRYPKTKNDLTVTDSERTSGTHVLGGTGVGKSTVAVSVASADITNGHGLFFIDTDGDSINTLLPLIPQERMDDVILLDLEELAKQGHFIGLNPVTLTDADRTLQIFKMRWEIGSATPRLENTLRLVLLTLAENKLTIAEIPELLENALFRKRCVDRLPHTYVWDKVRRYWEEDYNKLPPSLQRERADTILNKVYPLLTIEQMSYAISQDTTTVNFRELMDKNKIVLLKLSPQVLGDDTVAFLGLFVMSELKNALFSREDIPEDTRPFFGCFFDEWQLYITPDFEDILTRGRKYGCGAMVLNQTLEQLDKDLQAIARQLNIRVTFRVAENNADAVALRYARDPQPETEIERKLGIVVNPIEWLLDAKGAQENPVIDEFTRTILPIFNDAIKISHQEVAGMTRYGPRVVHIPVSDLDLVRRELNKVFYKVMRDKNPRKEIPIKIFSAFVEALAACRRERNESHASHSASACVVYGTGRSTRKERGRGQNRDGDGAQ